MSLEIVYKEIFSYNAIIIINAIPSGEYNTAKKLYEDLNDLYNTRQEESQCFLESANSIEEIREILESLSTNEAKILQPILHIEAHGMEGKGLLIGKDILSWDELYNYCVRINIQSKNNFGLILAGCCYSNALTKEIDLKKPCPFSYVIAPEKEVDVGAVRDQCKKFYVDLIKSGNLSKSFEAFDSRFLPFYSSRFIIDALFVHFYTNNSSKEKAKMREEVLSSILEDYPNAHTHKKFIRSLVKKTKLEDIAMDSINIFLHGKSPVTTKQIRDRLLHLKLIK